MISEKLLLESFLWASRGNETSNDNNESSGESGGGASYHDISMANSILAPDAFRYSG